MTIPRIRSVPNDPVPILPVSGSPREQGRLHARYAREAAPTRSQSTSSYGRYDPVTARLRAGRGDWDLQRMIRLVGDHTNNPQDSICRHPTRDGESVTAYTSIASLPDGTLWTRQESPCTASASEDRAARSAVRPSATDRA